MLLAWFAIVFYFNILLNRFQYIALKTAFPSLAFSIPSDWRSYVNLCRARRTNFKQSQQHLIPNCPIQLTILISNLEARCKKHKTFSDIFFLFYTLNRKNELRTSVAEDLPAILENYFERSFIPQTFESCWIDIGVEHFYTNPDRPSDKRSVLWRRSAVEQILTSARISPSYQTIDEYFYMHDISGGSGEPRVPENPVCAYVQFYHVDKTAYTTMMGSPFERLNFNDCLYQNINFSETTNAVMKLISSAPFRCRQEWRVKGSVFNDICEKVEYACTNYASQKAFLAIHSETIARYKKSIIYQFTVPFMLTSQNNFALTMDKKRRHFWYLMYILLKHSTMALTVNVRSHNLRKLFLCDIEDDGKVFDFSADVRTSLNLETMMSLTNRPYFMKDQVDFDLFQVNGGVNELFTFIAKRVLYSGAMEDSSNAHFTEPLRVLRAAVSAASTDFRSDRIAHALFELFTREMISKLPRLHKKIPAEEVNRVERTFDITSFCNYGIALSNKIQNASKYERFRFYFDGLLADASFERLSNLKVWQNCLFVQEWLKFKQCHLSLSFIQDVEYYLFKRFCRLQFLPCSERDRFWSVYRKGKLVKLLNMEELPKYPPNIQRLARPLPYYPVSENESSSDGEAMSDVHQNSPQSSKPVFRGERGPIGTVQKPTLVSEDRIAVDFDHIGDLPSSGESEPEPEYNSGTRLNFEENNLSSDSEEEASGISKKAEKRNGRWIHQRGRGSRRRGGNLSKLRNNQ